MSEDGPRQEPRRTRSR